MGVAFQDNINILMVFFSDQNGFEVSKDGQWGPNVQEFQTRFDPELTGGEGTHRLKNLYFVYLLGGYFGLYLCLLVFKMQYDEKLHILCCKSIV